MTMPEANRIAPLARAADGLDTKQDGRARPARERRQKLLRHLRRALLAALAAGALLAIALALRPQPVPIEVAVVGRGALETVVEESGTTRVKDRFVVSAPVAGSLSRIALEPGDLVREGDT